MVQNRFAGAPGWFNQVSISVLDFGCGHDLRVTGPSSRWGSVVRGESA